MSRDEILEFLNANPGCHLATMEGDKPRVRGMFMYRADEEGIIFHTGAFKSLYSQLQNYKNVEVCFNSPDKQVRVAGVAEVLGDEDLKKEILEARPWLKPLMGQQGEDALIVFRVTDCVVSVWTMETNLERTTYVNL
ncbi:MAG: pyridoxamine 5'-phosphate oxidase family protein [Smithellaceae bacterium]|nr:pyridoxamine 5'-phosphate oxidase family protein [Smithellaceae bacterium]